MEALPECSWLRLLLIEIQVLHDLVRLAVDLKDMPERTACMCLNPRPKNL
jgi:hypothetical protein